MNNGVIGRDALTDEFKEVEFFYNLFPVVLEI
jgi:hypothetical protein